MKDTWISLGEATAAVVNSIAEKHMASNSIKQYADQLSDIFNKIEHLKIEAAVLIDVAKEAGVNTKALRKVAREMVMESNKLAQKYADEEQLDMFRAQVGIFQRKGLAA